MKGNKEQLIKTAAEYYRFLNTIIEEGDADTAYKLEGTFRTTMCIAGDGMTCIGKTDESGKYTHLNIYERLSNDADYTVEI